MELVKNQIVRVKNYKNIPSGWVNYMLKFCGRIVKIEEINYTDRTITLHRDTDIYGCLWWVKNFQKVNTPLDKKR
jgi:hypothetical protein